MLENGIYFLPKITEDIGRLHRISDEDDAKPLFNSLAVHNANGERSFVNLYYPPNCSTNLRGNTWREWVFHRNQEPVIKVNKEMI